MKLTGLQLSAFNRPDSLLVISTYPDQKTTHTGGGLATYTKNSLLAIRKADPLRKIIVLANIIDEPETYLEKDILVIRCWERSLFHFYFPITKALLKFDQVKNILLGFEFAAYGDLFTTGLLPLYLSVLKLAGKRLTIVVHQVVADLTDLAIHTGIDKNKHLNLYNRLLIAYFQWLGFASHKIVTLEANLADRFNDIVSGHKAVAIPHGLYPKKAIDKKTAQRRLNLDSKNLYVLCFGYLSHYKGSDLIVKAFKKPLMVGGKRVRLILAGGENQTQGQKRHYQRFYKNLYKAIDNNPNIIHTGFVPDTRIKTFYSAADLTVFPYRTFMSASGPLSLAIAYRKPFVVSTALSNYSPTTFDLSIDSIRKTIKDTLSKKSKLYKLEQLSQIMSTERNFNHQGSLYLSLFTNPSPSPSRTLLVGR
ncbi:MAG: Glycosyltransferase, group 1 family protein [Microgenomates group bacterium GW2011_GWA2_46_7]|nr:MAG: Glycosyltransferase, group 1 family protein [Microgenomates group bacterium GW2011_GWA2_46_7]